MPDPLGPAYSTGMTQRTLILAILSAATMPVALASPDSDYATGPRTYLTRAIGGPGGAPFKMDCRNRDYLVGVHIRFDGWMDQIDGFCAMFRAGRTVLEPTELMGVGFNEPGNSSRFGTMGAAAGGDGGRANAALICPPEMVVTNLNFSRSVANGMLANAAITCAELGTGRTQVVQQNPQVFAPDETGWVPSQGCKSDSNWYYAASGLHGRAGSHVDAAGLICTAFRDGVYERPADQRRAEAAARQARNDRVIRNSVEESSNPRIGGGRLGGDAVRSGPRLGETGRPGREIAASARYDNPVISLRPRERSRLDWCVSWGQGCGKPAADAFCEYRDPDRPYSADFSMAPDVGRTQIISSGEFCNDAACDGFAHITCVSQPAVYLPPR